MSNPVAVSATSIEEYLWKVQHYLMLRHGASVAAFSVAPLRWYVDTGRASLPFLHALLAAKPFMIARRLHEGQYGSYDRAIEIIKEYLGLL